MKPHDLGGGRTLVKRTENFVYWCAWRWWLHRETGRTVLGEKLCVWGDWPPETLEMAQHVCQSIMAARKRIQFDFPVADPAQPWDRWSAAEREDLERRHREDFAWNPELPKPRSHARPTIFRTDLQRALDAFIIAEADKKPRVKREAPLPQIGRIPPRHARL